MHRVGEPDKVGIPFRKRIESKFEEIRNSLESKETIPKLTSDQIQWVKTLTNDIIQSIGTFKFCPSSTQSILPLLQIVYSIENIKT